MESMSMPNTIRLHRVLATSPEKVYRAFIEADALAKWLPPNGFACTVHHLEAKVGGVFKMSFRNFTTGESHAFGGEYVELVPGERLRYTDKFDDPNLPGEMQVTVILKKVSVGTEVDITQAGVPDVIPPEACYLGWQQSLRNLAKLVEPEINQFLAVWGWVATCPLVYRERSDHLSAFLGSAERGRFFVCGRPPGCKARA